MVKLYGLRVILSECTSVSLKGCFLVKKLCRSDREVESWVELYSLRMI